MAIAIIAFLSKEFIFHTLVLGPARPDFWSYRMSCRLGEWMEAPALCINELPFTLHSRQLAGQFMMHLLASLVLGLIGAFPYVIWELWRFVKPVIPPNKYRVIYGSVFLTLALACALMFQLPVAVYFLARVGIVTARSMRTYRRHTIVATLLLACYPYPS